MHLRALAATLLVLLIGVNSLPVRGEQVGEPRTDTPPRLSYIEGQASFWRPGAADWVTARINTPLAGGDALYTGDNSNLELQIGAGAFVRAGEKTQIGLVDQEPDFVQFKLTAGHTSLDLRSLPSGHTVEMDTPNAAFTIEHPGYYRVAVGDTTQFIARRGGRAAVTAAGGEAQSVAPSEEVVVRGTDAPTVETYVAPELDSWDDWNYARTDHEIDAVSTRYVPSGVYGTDALDHYGSWRVMPTYGPVWVPDAAAPGWVPYSTGSWVWDPYYGWTWVDNAPWGWAPFHYGRWVAVNGVWAWAPGPVVARPIYAPALVGFFEHHASVQIGLGVPVLSWVALGWGEPLCPWWGPAGFIGVPRWAGWGGPRIVNNVVVNRISVVNINNIVYQNTQVSNAIVAVRSDHFGQGPVTNARVRQVDPHVLRPVPGPLPAKPVAASFVATTERAIRPPEPVLSRRVVATRPPHEFATPRNGQAPAAKPSFKTPMPRLVSPPKQRNASVTSPPPPFGTLNAPERPRPPPPPSFADVKNSTGLHRFNQKGIEALPERWLALPHTALSQSPSAVPHAPAPSIPAGKDVAPPRAPIPPTYPEARHVERVPQVASKLPGDPANRLFPRRGWPALAHVNSVPRASPATHEPARPHAPVHATTPKKPAEQTR